jgi:hypothetical protein
MILAALAFVALCVPSGSARSVGKIRAELAPAAGQTIFLPAVYGSPSLAGTYDCFEYEFNLVWTTEVITLSVDGSSIYEYHPPHSTFVTGTWVYTPTVQQVGFTNFRWITATVELPDRLSARRYLPGPGFEVALRCNKRTP